MTAHFTPTGSGDAPHVTSETQVAQVKQVFGYTNPSGVYLVILVPLPAWLAETYDSYLETPAYNVEQLIAGQIVTAAVWYQQTDASTLLAGFVRFTVTYQPADATRGPFEGFVSAPMTTLALADPFDAPMAGGTLDSQVKGEYNRLVKLAGGPASSSL